MRSDIQPEALSPTMSCPIAPTKRASLASYRAINALILTLARGHYCPKEHRTFGARRVLPKIGGLHAGIVTIATDDHHTLQKMSYIVGAGSFLRTPTERSKRISTSGVHRPRARCN